MVNTVMMWWRCLPDLYIYVSHAVRGTKSDGSAAEAGSTQTLKTELIQELLKWKSKARVEQI